MFGHHHNIQIIKNVADIYFLLDRHRLINVKHDDDDRQSSIDKHDDDDDDEMAAQIESKNLFLIMRKYHHQ